MTRGLERTSNPASGASPTAFLSHASADHEFVDSILQRLEAEGHRCWVAYRDVKAGSDEIYAGQIMTAIETCPYFVVVLSQSSLNSPHVLREVERAVSERRRIISVRLEPVELTSSWEYLLSAVQWIDAFDRPISEVGRELVAAMKSAPSIWIPRPPVAWLGLALPVSMLLLSLFLRLQPPWPEPLVVSVLSVAALLAPAFGSTLFQPQLTAPIWLKRSLVASLLCLLVYSGLWGASVYEARLREPDDDSSLRPIPKVVGGFLPKEDVKALMTGPNRLVGLTYQKALENAAFDPDSVWKSWTVRCNSSALLVCWIGMFVGVGLALAASGKLTIGAGKK